MRCKHLLLAFVLTFMTIPCHAVEYTGTTLRDPFYMLTTISSETSSVEVQEQIEKEIADLSLDGIVWNTSEPRAIVNGNIVKPSGMIGSLQVLSIGKEGVKLSSQGREFMLTQKKKG